MDLPTSRRPTIPQVLLGLFIIWQLFFMGAANILGFFPHGEAEEGELSDSRVPPSPEGGGPIQSTIDFVGGLTGRWTKLTGQVQAWWLFAPEVPQQATFPTIELRWDHENEPSAAHSANDYLPPVILKSYFEPDNSRCYFRPPGYLDRLFHYEIRLGLIFVKWSEQSVKDHPEDWRKVVEQQLRRTWKSTRAYLRWRLEQFQQEHPELPPPRQAILSIRLYRTPPFDTEPFDWGVPHNQALARWVLDAPCPPGCIPIEMCDPVTGRFTRLQLKDSLRHD